jgi:hypothetical protein
VQRFLRRERVGNAPVRNKGAAPVHARVLVSDNGDILERTVLVKGREYVLLHEILGDLQTLYIGRERESNKSASVSVGEDSHEKDVTVAYRNSEFSFRTNLTDKELDRIIVAVVSFFFRIMSVTLGRRRLGAAGFDFLRRKTERLKLMRPLVHHHVRSAGISVTRRVGVDELRRRHAMMILLLIIEESAIIVIPQALAVVGSGSILDAAAAVIVKTQLHLHPVDELAASVRRRRHLSHGRLLLHKAYHKASRGWTRRLYCNDCRWMRCLEQGLQHQK